MEIIIWTVFSMLALAAIVGLLRFIQYLDSSDPMEEYFRDHPFFVDGVNINDPEYMKEKGHL